MDDLTPLVHLVAQAPPWVHSVLAYLAVAVTLTLLYMKAYPRLQATGEGAPLLLLHGGVALEYTAGVRTLYMGP